MAGLLEHVDVADHTFIFKTDMQNEAVTRFMQCDGSCDWHRLLPVTWFFSKTTQALKRGFI